jgi:hypothetical protein
MTRTPEELLAWLQALATGQGSPGAAAARPVAPGKARDAEKDDERTTASGALRRLVCFLASALDVRYAFVLALHHEGEGSPTRVDVWLAKDYGLRSEYAEPDIALYPPTPSTLDLVSVLRAAAPHEPELASIERKAVVSLPLVAASGRWLGHLGIVDPEGRRRLSAPEHLRPLARTAAAELSRWTGA